MIERHRLEPFFPKNAQTLILGSFPPPAARWSMEFFYPNLQNDFWRIFGIVFFNDLNFFLDSRTDGRNGISVHRFNQEKITVFLRRAKFAVYDAALEAVRTKDNAADDRLCVVKALDLDQTLHRLAHVKRIVFTGQKAAETLWPQIAPGESLRNIPKPGEALHRTLAGRTVTIARVCSPSRAYPLALEKKAEIYRRVFEEDSIPNLNTK